MPKATHSKIKPEIWWCAINPDGVAIWPYLQLRKSDCVEVMDRELPGWKKEGWRAGKLRVDEVSPNLRYVAAMDNATGAVCCLQTAIEMIHMGDTEAARRWIDRATSKLTIAEWRKHLKP